MNKLHDTSSPGHKLYVTVRAGFVKKGTSLAAWCRQHDVFRQNARDALLGTWNGPAAKTLRQWLIEESSDDRRDVA